MLEHSHLWCVFVCDILWCVFVCDILWFGGIGVWGLGLWFKKKIIDPTLANFIYLFVIHIILTNKKYI